jgi:hypothetical protein
MNERRAEIVAAFDDELAALIARLDALPERAYDQLTNCPPWDLRELVVHIAFSACTLADPLPRPAPDAVAISAADYYRRAERVDDGYRSDNVDRTRRVARRFPTGREACQAVATAWAATAPMLERLDAEAHLAGPENVRTSAGVASSTAIAVDDFLVTRLVALTAHAVDVAITLGERPWTMPSAADAVVPTLTDLLDGDPRRELGWTATDLLIVGTGRRALSDAERAALGPTADRFPLLS